MGHYTQKTAGQLLEELREVDPDLPVVISFKYTDEYGNSQVVSGTLRFSQVDRREVWAEIPLDKENEYVLNIHGNNDEG